VGLGSVVLSSAASGNAGTTFDTKKTLDFALTAAGGGVCQAFGTSATGWDIAIAPAKSGFLKTIGTGTFLGNMITAADGGTNAVVKLTGGVTTASNDINLNDTGTDVFVSAPNTANAFTLTIDNYASTTANKSFSVYGGATDSAGKRGTASFGVIRTTSGISSLVFYTGGGTLNAGTVLLYGVN
jgi:hypothetical protein